MTPRNSPIILTMANLLYCSDNWLICEKYNVIKRIPFNNFPNSCFFQSLPVTEQDVVLMKKCADFLGQSENNTDLQCLFPLCFISISVQWRLQDLPKNEISKIENSCFLNSKACFSTFPQKSAILRNRFKTCRKTQSFIHFPFRINPPLRLLNLLIKLPV